MTPEPGEGPWNDPQHLTELRQQMLRFARLQLDDDGLAEDAVQEALMGAMKNADSFRGGSAFKTWVYAILKNKIADTLRRKHRLVDASSLLKADDADDQALDKLFDGKGYWHLDQRPKSWEDPEGALQDGHFWRVFDACLDKLPPRQARVFMMREFIGLETGEICTSVELSVSNLHVLLHRARLRLRDCLEDHWFMGSPSPQ